MSTSDDSSTPDSPQESAQETTPTTSTSESTESDTSTEKSPSKAKDKTKAKTTAEDEDATKGKATKTRGARGDKKDKKKAKSADDAEDGAEEQASDSRRKRRRGDRPLPVPGMNPTWWAPVMCTLMVVGLLWIVVFYLLSNGTKDTWPIPGIGYGNLAIGFAMIMAGFLMTTRWR